MIKTFFWKRCKTPDYMGCNFFTNKIYNLSIVLLSIRNKVRSNWLTFNMSEYSWYLVLLIKLQKQSSWKFWDVKVKSVIHKKLLYFNWILFRTNLNRLKKKLYKNKLKHELCNKTRVWNINSVQLKNKLLLLTTFLPELYIISVMFLNQSFNEKKIKTELLLSEKNSSTSLFKFRFAWYYQGIVIWRTDVFVRSTPIHDGTFEDEFLMKGFSATPFPQFVSWSWNLTPI